MLGIKFGLLLWTDTNVRFSVGLPVPEVMPAREIDCGPAFSGIVNGLVIAVSPGGWLTGKTTTMNDWVAVVVPPVAVPPVSVTVTVIVAVPMALATGV